MDHKIETSLSTYCHFLQTIADAAIVATRTGDVVFANPPAMDLFGRTGDAFWASHVQQLIPQELRPAHQQHMQRYWDKPVARSMAEGEGLEVLKQDGSRVPVAIMLNPLELQDGVYALAVCRDMTRERRQQDNLQKALDREKTLSTTDPVTGAANRLHFRNELLYEIERSSRHASVFARLSGSG